MSEVVTGEAVRLDVRPAAFGSRALSGATDLILQGILGIGVIFLVGLVAVELDAAAGAALSLTLVIFVTVGIPLLIETLTRGRTLGKLILGLRTVRDDGGPIRFRHALIRSLVGFLEIFVLFGVPALITSLFTARGKRLGDVAAGTFVVRERATKQAAYLPVEPPGLRSWSSTADMRRLPDGMALSVRQFLGRAPSLHPESRGSLGVQLAEAVSPYVSPLPPAGTHPEDFLSAVLAERRRRDLQRMAREQQTRDRLAQVDSVEAVLAQVTSPVLGATALPQ